LSHTSIRLIVSSWENYCVAKIQTYKKYSDEYPEKWEALALHRGVYYESSNRIKEAFDLIDVMAFDDERHVELFNQVMIIRNAIVHDWGMITESNYEELRMSDKEIGHPLMLDPEQLDNCFSVIYHAVKNIEWAIDQKLNVKLAVTFFGGDVDWNEINIL
ncbi:MAG: hypothetical protein KJ773_05845, partial [Candidatus Thermoplasmatota archaeon]|nr:hypothetical protein [Candidatus Thermoplasmatota archaeon]